MTDILLIDYSSILHQTWHAESANPDPNATSTKVVARVRALASGKPHVALCCEGKGSFRKALDPTYKAQRPTPIAELHHQGDVALDVLRADGFPVWSADGYEADDVIATATTMFHGAEMPGTFIIASADKDLLQLVGPCVTVHSLTSGNDIDADGVLAKFGVAPHQMVDYLSLVGDTSDNIKGAKGIGAKGAAKLLTLFGNLDDLYTAIDKGDAAFTPAVQTSLLEFKDRAKTVRELITLKTDAPIPFDEIFKPRIPKNDDSPDWVVDEQIAADIEETMQPLTLMEAQNKYVRVFDADGASTDVKILPTRSLSPTETFKAPQMDVMPPELNTMRVPDDNRNSETGRVSATNAVVTREVATAPQTPDVLAPAPIEWERQLEPRSLRECETLAKAVMASRLNFGTYGSHFAVMSTVLAGRELGLQAMASLRAFHIVDAKPTMSADLIRALVLKSPLCEYFRNTERTPERATWATKRKGDPEVVLTFTLEEGKLAWSKDEKAWKGSAWTKYPSDMCSKTASAKLARMVYPDVVMNLYCQEELD